MKGIMELYTRSTKFKTLSTEARLLLVELIAFGGVGSRVDLQAFLDVVPWSPSSFTTALNELIHARLVVYWRARKNWCIVVGPDVEDVVPGNVAPLLARVPGSPRVFFAGTLHGGSDPVVSVSKERHVSMDQIKRAFRFWVKVTGRNPNRTKLVSERARAFRAMFQDYDEDDVFLAIYGIALSPYHQGENESGRKYDEPRVIRRNLEHFRDLALSQGMTRERIREMVNENED